MARKNTSTVALAERTPRTDAQSRERLRDAVSKRGHVLMTISPRVYADTNVHLPGNSPSFRLATKAEAIDVLRNFAKWAAAEKARIEGGRL